MRVQFRPALPHPHTAEHLLIFLQQNLGQHPYYHPYVCVSWMIHVTVGEEMISSGETAELSTVPGMWCALDNYVLRECEEGRKTKRL